MMSLLRARLLVAAAVLGVTAALVFAFAGGSSATSTAHAQGYPYVQSCGQQPGYVLDNNGNCVYVGYTVPGETCMSGLNGGVTCSGPVNWADFAQYPFSNAYWNTGYPWGWGYPFGGVYPSSFSTGLFFP